MSAPFDHIAAPYDAAFPQGAVGQLQRKHIWAYLQHVIDRLPGLDILELHQGSDEDALLFGSHGFTLVATDVTEEVARITEPPSRQYSMPSKISSQCLDPYHPEETLFDKHYHLIFSHTGGLNAMDPASLQRLLRQAATLLAPGGRLVAVVMPKLCLWEMLYFLITGRFRRIFRPWSARQSDGISPVLREFFYTPRQLKQLARHEFEVVAIKPVGFALPPVCLENVFSPRKKLLKFLNRWEERLRRFSFLAGMGDRYIIDLRKRAPRQR